MKKIKIRWLGGLCLLLFLTVFYSSDSDFSYYFFNVTDLPSIFELPVESHNFFENIKIYILNIDEIGMELFSYFLLLIFPVLIFLIFTYKTDKAVINNCSLKQLLLKNLIFFGIIFFFPFMLIVSISWMNALFFIYLIFSRALYILVPLFILLFGIIPSLFLYRFYANKKVISIVFFIFIFLTISIFLKQLHYYNTCGNYTYPVCLGEKAYAKKEPSLCEKSKDDPGDELFFTRNHCYLALSNDWDDERICNNLFMDSYLYSGCVLNIAVNTKDQSLCDLITYKNEKLECLSNFIPSTGGCLLTNYYCVAKKAIKWNDYSLCEKMVNEKKANSCYVSASYDWKDIGICHQISGDSNEAKNGRYTCVTNIAKNLKNRSLCKELEPIPYKWCLEHFD